MADKQLMIELGSLGLRWCFQTSRNTLKRAAGLAPRPSLGTLTLSIFWQELLGNNHSSTVLPKSYMLTQTQLSWVKAHCCCHVLFPVWMSLLFILFTSLCQKYLKVTVTCELLQSLKACTGCRSLCEVWSNTDSQWKFVPELYLADFKGTMCGERAKNISHESCLHMSEKMIERLRGYLLCSLNTKALGNNWTKTEMRDSDSPELKFGLVLDLREFQLFCPVTPKNMGSIQASCYDCWWFHLKGTFVGKWRGTRHLFLQNRENLEFVFFLFCCAFIVSNLWQNMSALPPGWTPLPV